MTNDLQAANREVAELLGIPWHEAVSDYNCSCGQEFNYHTDTEEHVYAANPDFISHPEELLREMRKRKDFLPFIAACHALDDPLEFVDYILDCTEGKLVLATREWKERGKG
jgi:hypothetical protein